MNKIQLTKWLFVTVLLVQVCAVGCHRGYYRRQADNEAQQLVAEKNTDPRWSYADGTVEIDPQSRMFDPFSQDHPPIPPDDAASHQLMYNVDGKDGFPHWHANGDTDFVENPEWRSYLPTNQEGKVVLDIETAFRLAQLHSTDFQQQREILYLSALEVSLERFGFDSQLFAGWNSFFSTQGRLRGKSPESVIPPRPDGSASSLSSALGSNGQGINLERMGVTGANFAVGLANTILWNFDGADTQSATSLIDFSIIQPLLRNAGRDRIMESLTQAERTLLANVRQLDRFRRGFYLEIIMGRNAGAGPNASGNFLTSPGSPSTNAGGYLGLLQQQQNIRIQELNIRQLENVLDLFNEFYDRERIDALQVFQFENTVYTQQNALLRSKINFQNSLDSFKRLLGLPPQLDIVIDDSFLDHFVFISDNINKRQIDLYGLKTLTGDTVITANNLIENRQGPVPESIAQQMQGIRENVVKTAEMVDQVLSVDAAEIRADIATLAEARPRRVAYFEELRRTMGQNELLSDIDPSLFSADSIAQPADLEAALEKAVVNLTAVKDVFDNVIATIDDTPNQRNTLDADAFAEHLTTILEQIPESISVFSSVLIEFTLLQAQARSDAIELIDVNITDDQAFSIARCFRRDWMNARASLVNQWRQIEVVADQLESQVDLVFEGSVGNFGNNPFKIRTETGQLRAGLRFDAPIVRMSERNNYRRTLINYQQSKRSFYQFRDDVHLGLRQTLRSLNLNKALFEVNRKSVQAAIKQVDNSELRLVQPVGPNQQARLGSTTSRDLTGAINALQQTQLAFLGTWVNYEVARRNLDFDMGTMQLDETGRWLDPGEIDPSIAGRASALMGITLDCQFCDEGAMFGSPDSEFADPLQFEQPGLELPMSPNGIQNEPSLAPVDEAPAAPKASTKDVPAPRPSGEKLEPESRLEAPKEIPVPDQPKSTQNSSKPEADAKLQAASIRAPFVLPAFEPIEHEFLEQSARIETIEQEEILPTLGRTDSSAVESPEVIGESKSASSEKPVKDVNSQPNFPSFAKTSAGQFEMIAPSSKNGQQPSSTSLQNESVQNPVSPPKFKFSALPNYQPIEFAQVGLSTEIPVVEESLISTSENVELLRPISATIDQLPWDSVQVSNRTEAPIARVMSENAPAQAQLLLKPLTPAHPTISTEEQPLAEQKNRPINSLRDRK